MGADLVEVDVIVSINMYDKQINIDAFKRRLERRLSTSNTISSYNIEEI